MMHNRALTSTKDLENAFISICSSLFKEQQCTVETSIEHYGTYEKNIIDLIITSPLGHKAIAEMKLYRTQKASLTLLERGLSHGSQLAEQLGIKHLVLITSTFIPPEVASDLKRQYDATLIDMSDLIMLCRPYPDLITQLDSFLNSLFPSHTQPRQLFPPRLQTIDLSCIWKVSAKCFKNKSSKGKELQEQLQMTLMNPQMRWTKYESLAFETIKHLFDKDLSGWYKNLKAEAGYNRFELLCRVNSKHDFWNSVSKTFNTRYIFFECKEYDELLRYKTAASQEINILAQALRSFGFFITRANKDDTSIKSLGAIYDTGTLIIAITDTDLLKMLSQKENGDDPTNMLYERLNEAMHDITK